MKFKSAKLFSILMVLLLVLSFASCKKKNNNNNNNPNENGDKTPTENINWTNEVGTEVPALTTTGTVESVVTDTYNTKTIKISNATTTEFNDYKTKVQSDGYTLTSDPKANLAGETAFELWNSEGASVKANFKSSQANTKGELTIVFTPKEEDRGNGQAPSNLKSDAQKGLLETSEYINMGFEVEGMTTLYAVYRNNGDYAIKTETMGTKISISVVGNKVIVVEDVSIMGFTSKRYVNDTLTTQQVNENKLLNGVLSTDDISEMLVNLASFYKGSGIRLYNGTKYQCETYDIVFDELTYTYDFLFKDGSLAYIMFEMGASSMGVSVTSKCVIGIGNKEELWNLPTSLPSGYTQVSYNEYTNGSDEPQPDDLNYALEHYDLPTNFVLTWDYMGFSNYKLVRIDNDIYGIGSETFFLKKTETGYDYYLQDYDLNDNFEMIYFWNDPESKTAAEAQAIIEDEFNILISNEVMDGITKSGSETYTYETISLEVDKYETPIMMGLQSVYCYAVDYSIIPYGAIRSYDDNNQLISQNEWKLTEFKTSVQSFEAENLELPE